MDRHQPWMYGEPNPVDTAAVPTATVIEKGDLIAVAAADNSPYAAADETWNIDLATTQEAFHDRFMGVSYDRSRAGDTDSIRCGTSGVHEFDCAAATFEVGDLVGPAKQSGNALESKKVVAVATANLAIGRVAKNYPSNTTKVYVEVFSTLMRGGVQAPA